MLQLPTSINKPSKPRTDSKIVQKSNTPKPETSSPRLQPASEIATSGYLSHSILQSSRDYNRHPRNHSCTMADPPSKTKPRKARAGIYQSMHNSGYQNFDLSDDDFFDSDGNASLWPTAKTRISDAEFLKLLSQAYNARSDLVKEWSGQIIVFEGGPPKGYALFRTVDLFVHGHPSGTYFRSVKGFVDHVHAIMTEKLDTCGCVVCVPR
ncbi:hypothetical protein D6C83_02145 [Aureobasidium pullulans]|uniref:Cryptic loci regulator 2 N-terminal domain-containing protein n=2 Tax=Aureobasidium pullulans TaxID=5580 RepID=A0A4T0E0B6_AURPU|nr:hypothetical protein D6C83_02145 [Aureobasidium pullulans]